MTAPTREQVVQWADKASGEELVIELPVSWLIELATLARADLEATIAEIFAIVAVVAARRGK